MGGRKPEPTVLKKLHGNPGRRKINKHEPMPVGDLSTAPNWFDPEQRESWDYILAHAPPGVLKMIDRGALVTFVIAETLHRQAVIKQRECGLMVDSPNGHQTQSPYLPIINKQAMLMLKAASDLGLTPTSRPKIIAGATHGSGSSLLTNQPKSSPEAGSLAAYLARRPSVQ